MPGNSKRITKRKSKAIKKSAIKKTLNKIDDNKKKNITYTTSVVPISLVTTEELEKMTRDNSFLLNPLIANASIQKDLMMAANRSKDLEKLHEYLFDPGNQATFDEKTLVNLYAVGIQDHHKTISEKIKMAEMSDKARLLRETSKYFVEKEKQMEMESLDMSHTSEIIQALLSESMRHALEDEMKKKWGGSNSYRPPENKKFEITSIDPDADD